MEGIARSFAYFSCPDTEAIAINRGRAVQILQHYLPAHHCKQLMPMLMSPITHPLSHAVYPAEVQCQKRRLKLAANGHEEIFRCSMRWAPSMIWGTPG
ncbi:hypothetical protein C1886_07090 [Pseudomonas sp. FW300-N1A1]|uniref:hypothetical protein n=1 Tax=Pseudomonas sp. FW300-N1A1 TaxID=2075555 RepID=UPI000CD297FD|nr:hypothetical protein [Pseudomonas sp. FW300-N1A1]POA20929.1 hypothetical protein C1886_07090 [Pseudomonas sp. FW300-N1A1]